MSKFMGVYEFLNFTNNTFQFKIIIFDKTYNVQVESHISYNETKTLVDHINKVLKSKSKQITKLAINYIASHYNKKITASDIAKHVKPIDVVIEDYSPAYIICDYDPWTNAGLGIQILPESEINVMDRDAYY